MGLADLAGKQPQQTKILWVICASHLQCARAKERDSVPHLYTMLILHLTCMAEEKTMKKNIARTFFEKLLHLKRLILRKSWRSFGCIIFLQPCQKSSLSNPPENMLFANVPGLLSWPLMCSLPFLADGHHLWPLMSLHIFTYLGWKRHQKGAVGKVTGSWQEN